ncbi:MAG: hypothetical protein IPK04_10230 [Bdellovibrionales bacterium]|nr:hypothetical protein [Bdellovibrionales bacterium]
MSKLMKILIPSLLLLLATSQAQAYMTILESGELVPSRMSRIGAISQIVTNDSSGLNADVTYDAGWNESSSSRFILGTGKMDIHMGGTFKWNLSLMWLANQPLVFDPYVALPISFTLNRNKDFFGQQFVIGSEFTTKRAPLFSFAAELALNLKDSYSYIAAFVSYQFDGKVGLPLR